MVKNYTVVLPNAKRQRSRRADVRNSLWWELSPPVRGLILSLRSPWKDVRVCTRPHSLSKVRCRAGSKTGSGKDQPIREKRKWDIWLGYFNLWILFRPKHTFILASLLVLKIWWIFKTVLSPFERSRIIECEQSVFCWKIHREEWKRAEASGEAANRE